MNCLSYEMYSYLPNQVVLGIPVHQWRLKMQWDGSQLQEKWSYWSLHSCTLYRMRIRVHFFCLRAYMCRRISIRGFVCPCVRPTFGKSHCFGAFNQWLNGFSSKQNSKQFSYSHHPNHSYTRGNDISTKRALSDQDWELYKGVLWPFGITNHPVAN